MDTPPQQNKLSPLCPFHSLTTPSVVYTAHCHQSPPLDSKLEVEKPSIILLCMPYPVPGTW